jgi:hypothetical protein
MALFLLCRFYRDCIYFTVMKKKENYIEGDTIALGVLLFWQQI